MTYSEDQTGFLFSSVFTKTRFSSKEWMEQMCLKMLTCFSWLCPKINVNINLSKVHSPTSGLWCNWKILPTLQPIVARQRCMRTNIKYSMLKQKLGVKKIAARYLPSFIWKGFSQVSQGFFLPSVYHNTAQNETARGAFKIITLAARSKEPVLSWAHNDLCLLPKLQLRKGSRLQFWSIICSPLC